jgi:serine protease Do
MAFTPQGVPTQGLGFAIPGDVVRDRVREFTKTASAAPKTANRATPASSLAKKYFGITMQDLTPDVARALGYEGGAGVVISDVEPGSPAHVAGMAQGLVILGVGRYDAESVAQIESLLEPISENSLVDFTVSVASRVRGQIVRRPITVTLKAR